ncbi:sulfurtransferase [Jiangella endophytica]|uniref:sulfurtransferase n=1 Tax=Jiangella endophytica TaxID=1623398 RepID=UPI000E341304|nr:rhodanese-like domain-containing protein [Jiangella endophytica]
MTTPADERHALVTAGWVDARRHDPALVIVDATVLRSEDGGRRVWLSGRPSFGDIGHLPGARFADLLGDLSDPDGATAFTRPAPARLAAALAALGITRETTVVAYDTGETRWAARLWWLLRGIGHPDVRVLDGGRDAWVRAGLPLERGTGDWTPAQRYGAIDEQDVYATREQVREASDGRRAGVLVHALDHESYSGGHIAGAVNVPWQSLLAADGTLDAGPRARRRLLDAAGPEPAVAYCGSGISATLVLLALHEAGREPGLLYDGSLADWAWHDEPLVTGGDPR